MHRRRTLAAFLAASFPLAAPSLVKAQELVAGGRLRVVGFLNSAVLRRGADGRFEGLTADVAGLVASRLGATPEVAALPNPGAFADALAGNDWDLALGPRVTAPGAAHWAGDLMLLDSQVVAAAGVEIAGLEALDRPGLRLAVVAGGPPERHFGAILRQATLVRMPSVEVAMAALAQRQVDAYAGNGDVAARAADTIAGARVVPGIFQTIEYAAGIPLSRSAAARARFAELLAEVRQAGLVAKAIERDRIRGTRVAS
jgi:polar amino acid transport system substrate-binding protein